MTDLKASMTALAEACAPGQGELLLATEGSKILDIAADALLDAREEAERFRDRCERLEAGMANRAALRTRIGELETRLAHALRSANR